MNNVGLLTILYLLGFKDIDM